MSEHRSHKSAPQPVPWHVPVAGDDVGESGQQFSLAADEDIRAAVRRVAGLRDLPRLEVHFEVTRYGSEGLRVAGRVSATVGQNCVVTLEPLTNEVDEGVDLVFMPQRLDAPNAGEPAGSEQPMERVWSRENWGEPEPLIGGIVDLGSIATEFLLLGLDPYPRKPGAVFAPLQDLKADDGPFAVLARLAKGRDDR